MTVFTCLNAIFLGAAEVDAKGKVKVKNPARIGHEQVLLFSALAREEIRATVVASDSTRLVLQIHNDTDRPLAIKLPNALGARPVLAQFGRPMGGGLVGGGFPAIGGGGIAGNPGLNPGASGGNQGLGFGMPGAAAGGGGPGFGMGRGNPGGGGPLAGVPGGFFNVLPGKTVKKRFKTVCLDHGKPDPNKKIRYELAPLSELNEQQDLAALLTQLADERVNQVIAQLAAWRLANGKSWSELAATPYVTANGRRQLRFSDEQIEAARKLVHRIQAARRKARSKNATPSQSPGEIAEVAGE